MSSNCSFLTNEVNHSLSAENGNIAENLHQILPTVVKDEYEFSSCGILEAGV